jgi:hypothetical protein
MIRPARHVIRNHYQAVMAYNLCIDNAVIAIIIMGHYIELTEGLTQFD